MARESAADEAELRPQPRRGVRASRAPTPGQWGRPGGTGRARCQKRVGPCAWAGRPLSQGTLPCAGGGREGRRCTLSTWDTGEGATGLPACGHNTPSGAPSWPGRIRGTRLPPEGGGRKWEAAGPGGGRPVYTCVPVHVCTRVHVCVCAYMCVCSCLPQGHWLALSGCPPAACPAPGLWGLRGLWDMGGWGLGAP